MNYFHFLAVVARQNALLSIATQTMSRKLGGAWGTVHLSTKFPLYTPTLPALIYLLIIYLLYILIIYKSAIASTFAIVALIQLRLHLRAGDAAK